MDSRLFLTLNSLAGRWAPLDGIVRLVAKDGAILFPLALLLAWVIPGRDRLRGRSAVLLGALALVAALGVNQLAGHVVHRDRPFVHHRVTKLIPHPANNSFPSDHTAAASGAATGIWLARKRLGALLGVLAALLGISRVIAGVHYPGDIAAGALTGIACAALLWLFLRNQIEAVTRFGDRIYEAILRPFRRTRAA